MARFVHLGGTIINLDQVLFAEWVLTNPKPGAGPAQRLLIVSLAGPNARVYGKDTWGVGPVSVPIPEGDPTAGRLWDLLLSLCDPRIPLGSLPERTVPV